MLTITVADPEGFTLKGKPVTYTGAFAKLYNWRNHRQVNEIYGMIELEKIRALIAENPCNLDAHRMIEISSVLYSTHVVNRIKTSLYFMLIIILIGISSTNYITLTRLNKV